MAARVVVKPIKIRLALNHGRMFGNFQWPLQRSDSCWSRLARYKNGLFTLRNRPILMNLSRGIKTPTPLYWSKNISTDLRDSRGWSIWFEKTGIPEKNGKITSLSLSLMIVRALSTGTLVKSAVTSYDTSFCPGGISRFCIWVKPKTCVTKICRNRSKRRIVSQQPLQSKF